MDQAHFDVIVAGVGAMGSAACYELARPKGRVLGPEQFGVPHDRGSWPGRSRMIRLAYYEHPDYVPLLRRAYENWRSLEAATGEKILYITGGLYARPRDGELVSGSLRAASEHHLAHELLDHAELARRFPQLDVPTDHVAVHEAEAGFVCPERAIELFTEQAVRTGADIRHHEPLRAWSSDERGVTVTTEHGKYHAQHLLLCGGAWSATLARDLGID